MAAPPVIKAVEERTPRPFIGDGAGARAGRVARRKDAFVLGNVQTGVDGRGLRKVVGVRRARPTRWRGGCGAAIGVEMEVRLLGHGF